MPSGLPLRRSHTSSKPPWNQQQLHRELLFTHRKGLSLRSKPELLQVLEHRNRRRDGTESSLAQSPLERELLHWQQRREQRQQVEATDDPVGDQPEFIRVRENLRRTQCSWDPPHPHCATSSAIATPSLRSCLTTRLLSRIPGSLSPPTEASQLQSSLEASSLSSASSQCALNNS
ncbi:hypothetical protein lerEdw1_006865 [Lerista edwardsae]|nr:hypothetical protein lerEdw1_006865 [Lerista edwardsae]